MVTVIVFSLLIVGLVYPGVALVFGAIQFVFRWLYVWGYKAGPSKRVSGALPIILTLFLQFIMAFVSLYTWT